MSINTPQIYVACLAAYNNGKLHGKWIDATQEEETIGEEISAVLKSSPEPNAEEWAIHDYDGFEGVSIGEYQGIPSVVELAKFIEKHGKVGVMLLSHFDNDLAQATSTFEDGYFGEYQSAADFAEETISNSTEIPDNLKYYIDWEKMARDMEINGEFFSLETGYQEVHIFCQC